MLYVCVMNKILKQSKANLNSKFSFSLTGYRTKNKELSTCYYLLVAGEKNRWIPTFLNNISAMWYANNLIQGLISDRHLDQ